MNQEEQRIAIAKACGFLFEFKPRPEMMSDIPSWVVTFPNGDVRTGWRETYYTSHSRTGVDDTFHTFKSISQALQHLDIPDYCNNLNAMRDAIVLMFEKGINGLRGGWGLSIYAHDLDQIISRDHRGECNHRRLIPTAAQQAEAFLRTLNLWENS